MENKDTAPRRGRFEKEIGECLLANKVLREKKARDMSIYIGSRFYRAPEVILLDPNYD